MAGTVQETTNDEVEMMSELVAQAAHDNEPHPPQMCPDDGACHHRCVAVCWRSVWCLPLSDYGVRLMARRLPPHTCRDNLIATAGPRWLLLLASRTTTSTRPLPAHAGMTRSHRGPRLPPRPAPRTRRDDPIAHDQKQLLRKPLPAHAGMTRQDRRQHTGARPAPRTRRDDTIGWTEPVGSSHRSRTRRDEPSTLGSQWRALDPFPAHAGMTRGRAAGGCAARPAPRTRRDALTAVEYSRMCHGLCGGLGFGL